MKTMKKFALVFAISAILLAGCGREEPAPEPTPTPESVAIEETKERLQEQVAIELPENAQQALLRDVQQGTSSGIATREYLDNTFTHTIIADLPDAGAGAFYQAWLVRDQDNHRVKTGRLNASKGGFLLEYTSSEDYSDHDQVQVSRETTDNTEPETSVIEGVFN